MVVEAGQRVVARRRRVRPQRETELVVVVICVNFNCGLVAFRIRGTLLTHPVHTGSTNSVS